LCCLSLRFFQNKEKKKFLKTRNKEMTAVVVVRSTNATPPKNQKTEKLTTQKQKQNTVRCFELRRTICAPHTNTATPQHLNTR